MSDPTERAQALAAWFQVEFGWTLKQQSQALSLLACPSQSCGQCVCCLTLKLGMEQSVLSMTVHRLGGEVEGRPTERVNFLQRIDELRAIEEAQPWTGRGKDWKSKYLVMRKALENRAEQAEAEVVSLRAERDILQRQNDNLLRANADWEVAVDKAEAQLSTLTASLQAKEAAQAKTLAELAHRDQKDRVDGSPYVEHVRRVVALVPPGAEAVAWLHDVVEDCEVFADDGDAWLCGFGFSERTIEAVLLLTRGWHIPRDSYEEYITHLIESGNITAMQVKLADLADHLHPNCPASLRPRYEVAQPRIQQALAALLPPAEAPKP